MSSMSLSMAMNSTRSETARAVVAARREWGDGIARFGRTAAQDGDSAIVPQQLDDAAHQVIRALVAVAFLEQQASRGQLAQHGLARQRLQVLGFQSVERGK